MKHIKVLDYPKLPDTLNQKIINFVLKTAKNNDIRLGVESVEENSLGVTSAEFYEQYGDCGSADEIELSEDIIDEIKEHIFYKDYNIGLISALHIIPGNKKFLPHIDPTPVRWVINYVLEPGGENVLTQFWNPKKEYAHQNITFATFPYDKLDLAEEFYSQPQSWYEIDTHTIHSVDNLSSDRILLRAEIL